MSKLFAGFLRVALCIALIIPVFIGSALGGQTVAKAVGAPWLSPVFHGVTWIAGVLLVVWVLRTKIDRAPWRDLGLPLPQLGRLGLGAVLGVLAILLAAAIEHQLGWLQIARVDLADHRGVPKLGWIALCLIPSLGVGLAEELSFRGYVFRTLGERMPAWVAALLMGVIFGTLHFTLSGFGPAFVVSVLVISTSYVFLRFATGSLWFPIGFHGAWDWTQTYLVGIGNVGSAGYDPALVQVRQSGPALWVGSGQTIESGGLFLVMEVAILAVALVWMVRARRSPDWRRPLAPAGGAPTPSDARASA
jgi:membrane protease YdiL (CAAX protease family)